MFCGFNEISTGTDAVKVVLETIQKGTQAKSLVMQLTDKAEKWFRVNGRVVIRYFNENREFRHTSISDPSSTNDCLSMWTNYFYLSQLPFLHVIIDIKLSISQTCEV